MSGAVMDAAAHRALSPFNTSAAIDQIKNMTITTPPSVEEAYKNGFLTQEQYDNIVDAYRRSNESTKEALKNAEAADQWFKDYEANMSSKQPTVVSGPSPTVIIERDTSSSSSGSNTASIVGLALGAVATVAVIIGLVVFIKRRRQQPKGERRQKAKHGSEIDEETEGSSLNYSSMNRMPRSNHHTLLDDDSAPWRDEALLAVRVPLEKIERGELVSRGGFGEVYRGRYKGSHVAIKVLLPEKRKDVVQIKTFLAEIKFMSTLDHPRIVQFIGVAWESLSELCVVTEFLSGGDLRSLLMAFETSSPPRERGFDADKVKIALHVAHALTYLHSLQPIVLHRDLKSRNILLDNAWDAKLTDFGVSRERIDKTMTAGVGSSLWMAPEVMMGERYDEKADMFSFGVVLSELDTQQLPYSDAREEGTGRQIPQTAVLQLVSIGRLKISLTPSDRFPELQKLARDCVSLSAADRPTAAEALHRLHLAWKNAAEPGGLI